MGEWYDKQFNDSHCEHLPPITRVGDRYYRDRDILASLSTLSTPQLPDWRWTTKYLREAGQLLENAAPGEQRNETYAILRAGDSDSQTIYYPVWAKARNLRKRKSWVIAMDMDYLFRSQLDKLQELVAADGDTPWASKIETVQWQGSCTGIWYDNSELYSRVKFVSQFHNNMSVDIAFSSGCPRLRGHWRARNQTLWFRPSMSMEKSLQYKYLLSLEGNDVATNLKWLLASSSVVFMPPPTASAWLMEDLLVPFVHYVPLLPDGSDLEEMIEWAKSNDAKCQWISQQATQYMEQLWTGEQAQINHKLIQVEMAQRYYQQFGEAIGKCVEQGT